jgi:GT2 family glycosyltransferase
MKRSLYTIIISYNKLEPVFRAVDSVFKNHKHSKIILIDNSEDTYFFKKLKQKLKTYKENILFIKNKKNLGFSKAVNQGIKIALNKGADYILLLNDDAYLDKNCIPYLIEALDKDNKAMLAGPTIFYDKDKSKIWSTGGYFNKLLGNIKILLKNKKVNPDTLKNLNIQEVDFLTGCVLMIKSEAIKKIGLFNEDLFFYGEDVDYSLRAKRKGFKILWVPYAFAWHDVDIVKGRTNPFVMYNLSRSKIIIRKSHFKRKYFIYYLILHFLLHTPYKFYQILRGSKDFDSIKFWLKGTWDGIRAK